MAQKNVERIGRSPESLAGRSRRGRIASILFESGLDSSRSMYDEVQHENDTGQRDVEEEMSSLAALFCSLLNAKPVAEQVTFHAANTRNPNMPFPAYII